MLLKCHGSMVKDFFSRSSCIYPKTHQPIKEEYLMTGELEKLMNGMQ